ncbi:MAG: gamma-glutamyltransferase family protein [Planctomycetota bacterium]
MPNTSTGSSGGRPVVMSTKGVVSSGHYLATQIGIDVLRRGGNAFDAAAAIGFALSLVHPHQNGIGGEVPTLVYSARDGRAFAVSGHGTAPAAATIALFRDEYGLEIIPGDGFLPALVPCMPATWILVLERFGTMRLADVLMPTIRLAEEGFPVYDALRNAIEKLAERMKKEWPSSAAIYLRGGGAPQNGALIRNADWARTFKRLVRAETRCRGRKRGLRAARDEFYRGPIARKVVRFCRSTAVPDASGKAHRGLLTGEDFAAYRAKVVEPVTTTYRGIRVHKCGPWTQGPVLLQTLNLLEGYALARMGHNSADYVHTVVECMKLAYSDREFYYGDPDFVRVPLGRLLSKKYAAARRRLVNKRRASLELRPGGSDPVRVKSVVGVNAVFAHDTTKLEVIDSAGNMVSATPSGGWITASPVIPGLGFPLGTRGQMFSLVAGHPNSLEPGKRPRTTLTPSLATLRGKPFMVFGSPGGDAQDQWALQFLLNVVEFGMSLQEAVEAPTFWSTHWPSSFYPRAAEPGKVNVEKRIPAGVRRELKSRGHRVKVLGAWSGGNTLAAMIDRKTGVRLAAASPRLEPAVAAAL